MRPGGARGPGLGRCGDVRWGRDAGSWAEQPPKPQAPLSGFCSVLSHSLINFSINWHLFSCLKFWNKIHIPKNHEFNYFNTCNSLILSTFTVSCHHPHSRIPEYVYHPKKEALCLLVMRPPALPPPWAPGTHEPPSCGWACLFWRFTHVGSHTVQPFVWPLPCLCSHVRCVRFCLTSFGVLVLCVIFVIVMCSWHVCLDHCVTSFVSANGFFLFFSSSVLSHSSVATRAVFWLLSEWNAFPTFVLSACLCVWRYTAYAKLRHFVSLFCNLRLLIGEVSTFIFNVIPHKKELLVFCYLFSTYSFFLALEFLHYCLLLC